MVPRTGMMAPVSASVVEPSSAKREGSWSGLELQSASGVLQFAPGHSGEMVPRVLHRGTGSLQQSNLERLELQTLQTGRHPESRCKGIVLLLNSFKSSFARERVLWVARLPRQIGWPFRFLLPSLLALVHLASALNLGIPATGTDTRPLR